MTVGANVRSPDVLIVVMDCLRADTFERALADPRQLPFLRTLKQEVLSFPGAVAPSSWTIPSHASLFTGLYPWDHGAHNKSGAILTQTPETLAGCLARSGYATACFTANGYIQPATGLTRGFDVVKWGGDTEFFFRFLENKEASCIDLGGPMAGMFNRMADSPMPSPLWYATIAALTTFPGLWDALNRVGASLWGAKASELPSVAPWIERDLDAWLAKQPPTQPIFAFVNLLEAHEPYLANAGYSLSLRNWLRFARTKQDLHRWLRGRWTPSQDDLRAIRESYQAALATIDARVERLIGTLRARGRWNNTLFVLTSDHGQAFLEHGTLFHRLRVDEELIRIPLWIRRPSHGTTYREAAGWASLIDVPRTVVEEVGADWYGDPSARYLSSTLPMPPQRMVHSMNDGLTPNEAPELPPERRAFLDRFDVVTYQGRLKAIASKSGPARLFGVSSESPLQGVVELAVTPEAKELVEFTRDLQESAWSRASGQPYHGTVERRIAGWGY